MVVTKREKYIGIGVAAAVAILAADQLAIEPYLARAKAIAADTEATSGDLSDAALLFAKQRKLRPIWADIQKGGLKTNASDAESQALHAVNDWASAAGVTLSSVKPERTEVQGPDKQFKVVSFHMTASGHMPNVARLLWALETASVPVRVNDMQLSPPKAGTDDLKLELSVSTLCRPATAPPVAARNGHASEVAS